MGDEDDENELHSRLVRHLGWEVSEAWNGGLSKIRTLGKVVATHRLPHRVYVCPLFQTLVLIVDSQWYL